MPAAARMSSSPSGLAIRSWIAALAASGLAEGLRARLRREKDGHLASLREMEFDYRTGKLAEDDYAAMRSEVETRAIEALRQLDAVEASVGLDAQLEEEIRALKASIAARGAGAGGVRA